MAVSEWRRQRAGHVKSLRLREPYLTLANDSAQYDRLAMVVSVRLYI
jgi:hypothetical protein